MHLTSKRRAVTLIELLVVLVIIAILVGIQTINGIWAMGKARETAGIANKRVEETTTTAHGLAGN